MSKVFYFVFQEHRFYKVYLASQLIFHGRTERTLKWYTVNDNSKGELLFRLLGTHTLIQIRGGNSTFWKKQRKTICSSDFLTQSSPKGASETYRICKVVKGSLADCPNLFLFLPYHEQSSGCTHSLLLREISLLKQVHPCRDRQPIILTRSKAVRSLNLATKWALSLKLQISPYKLQADIFIPLWLANTSTTRLIINWWEGGNREEGHYLSPQTPNTKSQLYLNGKIWHFLKDFYLNFSSF